MPKKLIVFVIAMAICVTGSSFLWPMNAIYVTEKLGQSQTMAGFILLLNSGASLVGNLWGGYLFDKIGPRKTIIGSIVFTIVVLGALNIDHGWPMYPIWLTVLGLGSGVLFPAVYALASTVWPEGGQKAFNAIYVAQNVGVAIGAGLSGVIAKWSFDYLFIANTSLYVLFFVVILYGFYLLPSDYAQKAKEYTSNSHTFAGGFFVLMMLCAAYFFCTLAYSQWGATIAAYTQQINLSLDQYSVLWTINGGLIVFGQPLVALAKKWLPRAKTQLNVGLLLFIASSVVITIGHSFFHFAMGMVVLTLGEMLVWPLIPAIASKLAPEGKEGRYQGIVSGTATAGRMFGPLIGGIIVDVSGMETLFLAIIAMLIVSFAFTLLYDRRLAEREAKMIA